MLENFAASQPLATDPLKQRRSTVAVDTTLFSDLQVHRRFPSQSLVVAVFVALRPWSCGDGHLRW